MEALNPILQNYYMNNEPPWDIDAGRRIFDGMANFRQIQIGEK